MENNGKIIRAFEALSGRFVKAFHDEAKGYIFQTCEGWERIEFEHLNELAGLGSFNRSLINN